MNIDNQEKRTRSDRTTYCIAVIQLKELHAGSDVRIDQYAKLIDIDDNIATIVSRKYGISKDIIDSVSISFTTNNNAHLGFSGHVMNVVVDNGVAVYTVEIPKVKHLYLKNGTVLELPNENLIKYKNIHKAKNVGSKKKSQNIIMEMNVENNTGREREIIYDECNGVNNGACRAI